MNPRSQKSAARTQIYAHQQDDVVHQLCDKSSLGPWKPFAQWIVENRPELLDRKGRQGATPLHLAIKNERHEFVDLILSKSKDLRTKLEHTADGANCLHWAILLESPFTEAIIIKARELYSSRGSSKYSSGRSATSSRPSKDNSSADVFTARPGLDQMKNRTPLHLACWIEDKGRENNPDIRKYGDIDQRHVGGKGSRHRAKDKTSRVTESTNRTSNFKDERKGGASGGPRGRDGLMLKTVQRAPTFKTLKVDPTAPMTPVEKRDRDFKEPPDPPSWGTEWNRLRVVQLLVEARPRVLLEGRSGRAEDERTPFQQRLYSPHVWPEGDTNDENRSARIDMDQILTYLRWYIVDNFNRRDTIKALYSVREERALEFDLSGLPRTNISQYFLKDLGKILRFEDVLKYVALPRLSIENGKGLRAIMAIDREREGKGAADNNDQHATSDDREGTGLSHMCEIFSWLKAKGVKSIVKVKVVDDVEPSHSDEAIEACLDSLDVRVWDWRKMDLCSDVILHSAENARDVKLYSTGNNAVLKGWSSTSGLARLQHLKRVHVFVRVGLDSRNRTKRYMEMFENDFRASWEALERQGNIDISWSLVEADQTYDSSLPNRSERENDSRWMSSMKDFAGFLQQSERYAGENVKPVKIAVIDDGLNTNKDFHIFQDRIGGGESFYNIDDMTGRWAPFYVPSGPHGTQMAQLICQVCPVVKLYIAQLEVIHGQGGKRSFNPESATEAIKWATEQNVDIISMSWSIDTGTSLTNLEKAIQAAVGNGIIMFCSSIDEGPAALDDTYPGKVPGCIKIGASTGNGTKLSWVSHSKVNFLLPGDVLLSSAAQPSEMNANGKHSLEQPGTSGSSVSTALAAGLAGVLLYCDRLLKSAPTKTGSSYAHSQADSHEDYDHLDEDDSEVESHHGDDEEDDLEFLRRLDNMKHAFEALSVPVSDNCKFVQAWGDVWDELKGERGKNKLLWDFEGDYDTSMDTKAKLTSFMDKIKKQK